ncbi:subtilase family protein [Fontibacillus phaseoli]|uniref:Subtilase family protein n=1 Tax=Fontibacillus phaseoli TaxID=1416533 RepID=A0A369B1G9_9BACL|nr:S8 family peptidase [Fontibacillus phaseoli]RCX14418.1 subtilase family protein [Fontibacillus phaseoli]
MDYSSFLRYLNEHIDTSGKSGRRIIRFPHPTLFAEFVKQLRARRRQYPALRRVRTSSLLQAFFCPLPLPGGEAWRRFGLLVEEDARVAVHSAAVPSKELPTGTPWGVRHIGAPDAWSVSTGNQVRIGVIDTGADFNHPDLRHSLARGVNLLNQMSLPFDDNGHGTHIAGTIAASGGSKSMMGVAPRSLIYPVKAFDHNGSAYVSDIILGIDWCVQNRMNIINMSFGMKSKSQSLQNTIRKAYNAGIVVVASSGNDKKSRGADYPARYPHTISVGATGKDGRIAPFSNHGPRIDIYAPGEKVKSCWLGGGYREMNGTSMATSHVSGSIALLLAHRPGLSPGEIKRRLRRTARPLYSPSSKTKLGAGEVNAARLLRGKPAAASKKPSGRS